MYATLAMNTATPLSSGLTATQSFTLICNTKLQHYVIKFVSDLRQVVCFLWVSSTNKTDRHDITEILLKWR
jgi:hypothetical protein